MLRQALPVSKRHLVSTLRFNLTTASSARFCLSTERITSSRLVQSSRRELSTSTTRSLSTSSAATSSSSFEIDWKTILYSIAGGLVITTAGGVHYFSTHVGGTEGLFRSLSFYSFAIPKYLEYRYHLWQQSPQKEWDALDQQASHGALAKILELQGFYTKCGQMCAANIGDAFPPIWQDTMAILQDEVPPRDFSTILQTVKSELDFEKTFQSFDPVPIGSASIGQVHRAVLHDGTRVVVKVRYPDVERLLRGDVRTLTLFCQVAQPVHVPALLEVEKQFQTEFDYRQEAEQLAVVRANLEKAGLCGPDKLCRVPQPYLEYCTKRVLVMEELNGDKLAVALKRDLQVYAERSGQTLEEFMAQQKLTEKQAESKGEDLQGFSAREYDLLIALEDAKRRTANGSKRLYNLAVGWMPGRERKEYADHRELPLNHAKLVDDLIYVHGHEALVDGYFNGDPHPGNILLCRKKDGSPQLGLIDYGQVKRLSKKDRHLFSRIVIALDDDNKEEIARLVREAGFRSEKMDPEVMYLYARVGYDQDSRELTHGKHIQMFMEELNERDPILEFPREFLMVARTSVLLRGLAHVLHQKRSVAKIWRPIAERVLNEDI